MSLYSLDLETAPTDKTANPYALEPFRYGQGKALITSAAIAGPDDYIKQLHIRGEGASDLNNISDILDFLAGKEVVAHNAVFDIAWLIEATNLETVSKVKWRDTQLLAKWINNGQEAEKGKSTHYASEGRFSYSLKALCAYYLQGHPLLEEFLSVKDDSHEAGEDYEYWLHRGKLDAIMTLALYKTMMNIIPEAQINGYQIEQGVLVPVANSWVKGIHLDRKGAEALKPKIANAKKNLAGKLGKPEGMFTSPKQLSKYLFEDLGLTPISRSPKTGNPSTSADDLKLLQYRLAGTKEGDILTTILDFKQVKTLESKFIDGIIKVCNYNGYDINHSAPRIFGTYTGRFTYSSKTIKEKFKPGIATHQLPRKGPTRRLLKAPEGYVVGELDAAAQELRGIGIESRDPELIRGFNLGLDLHAGMAAHIAGEPYDPFVKRYKNGAEDAINYRYAGKLLNLSCQYRIGNKSLASKFFTTYGIVISIAMASSYLSLYKSRYKGVVQYWDDAISKAKQNGYAETIGGRRYGLTDWGSKSWQTESSAINFPIQGFGADHKDIAIAALYRKFPEAIFLLDLHDGLWYAVPEQYGDELLLDMRDYVSNLPYSDIWGKEVPLPLPFDAQIGDSFGSVREITR